MLQGSTGVDERALHGGLALLRAILVQEHGAFQDCDGRTVTRARVYLGEFIAGQESVRVSINGTISCWARTREAVLPVYAGFCQVVSDVRVAVPNASWEHMWSLDASPQVGALLRKRGRNRFWPLPVQNYVLEQFDNIVAARYTWRTRPGLTK